MVGCTRRPRKRAQVRFADPPWSERSSEWQIRDRQVSADHPARAVVEAMKALDLRPLFALYLGVGSLAIRPDLMLRIVLIEIRLGRPRPAQWFRDARENIVLQWAGFGIAPSRTCWYNFADRITPLIDDWNATVLQAARQQGVTEARRASLDGSAVAANASRHLPGRSPVALDRPAETAAGRWPDPRGAQLRLRAAALSGVPSAGRLLFQSEPGSRRQTE